ncbi:hypothetical protein [Paenibacillus xylaniclasticus]|uniref:hypothetical protein n=1 Tax=Paenibacillus xylaniclasticus TaxID=588083 RepID=UPI000FDBA276|nr:MULTISPECIES: hypothetical protein [Paenibacillus]GFN31108.1 hypothetical protein PCURB6_13680 [Paenibacillus curdlanolyticus]
MAIETIPLQQISITSSDGTTRELSFLSAELFIVTEFGSRQWYIDTTEAGPVDLLDHYYTSDEIKVRLAAAAADGRQFEGIAYVHSNVPKQACVLRGDDELLEKGLKG